MKKTVVTVVGKDSVGIIAKVCTYLANNTINILDISQTIVGEISKENNYPALAYEAVRCQIWEEMGSKEVPFQLQVAERDKPSQLVTI